jgi:DNA invertase Pin-like site-specific DNA recombinase
MPVTKINGQNVGYVRVSTVIQNTARQLDGVALDKVFEDKASGKNTDRPQLAACMSHLREGDTLHVHSMDRLCRNLDDLRRIVKELTGRGVVVRFHKEGLTFTGEDSPMSNLLLSMLGAVAEFERSIILERQREGIAIAKVEGKYKGRKPSLTADRIQELRQRAASGEKKTALAREFGVSRETVYSYLSGEAVKLIVQVGAECAVQLP